MARDDGVHRVEEAHRIAVVRSKALVTLRDGPMSRTTLQRQLRTSKSTAYRMTTALEENGFVERTGGEYRLTAAGRVAAERAESLCRAVTAIDHVDPLFELIDREALGLDPVLLEDAVVTHATQEEPYGPLRRFWSVVSESKELSMLYNTIHAPDSITRYHDLVEDGLDLTVIYDPETVEQNVAVLEEHCPAMFDAAGAELRVGKESYSGGIALTEDRVGVMGNDPTRGTQVVAVDTGDPAALEWGSDLIDGHYERSEPVER